MTSSDSSAYIAVRDVSKAFGAKQVLDNVSLEIAKGESFVIIGGSGTGKSVLLKSILGLLTPDSGQIMFDGEDITGVQGSRQEMLMHRFGMLFQGGALFDSLTVWENITFAVRGQQRMRKSNAVELAVSKLKQVGLSADVAHQRPSELSGGMQKRVALARAICGDPDVIFFDEPTTGLDPIMSDVINHLIVSCCKDIGATAVSITHDMRSATTIADRVAMLHKGKILWQGAAGDVMESGHAHVHQFVHGHADGPIETVV